MNNNENKKSYYAIIPANVRYDKRLPMGARMLYGEITALCNEKGYCWATNKYFSELYENSQNTVSLWISRLKKYGYIELKLIYEGMQVIERRLILNDTCHEKSIEDIPKNDDIPILKNREVNIKVINNTINNKVYSGNDLTLHVTNKIKHLDFVYLLQSEYDKLIDKYKLSDINLYIEKLNNYIGSKGKKYKSHYFTLLTWMKADSKVIPNQKIVYCPDCFDSMTVDSDGSMWCKTCSRSKKHSLSKQEMESRSGRDTQH